MNEPFANFENNQETTPVSNIGKLLLPIAERLYKLADSSHKDEIVISEISELIKAIRVVDIQHNLLLDIQSYNLILPIAEKLFSSLNKFFESDQFFDLDGSIGVRPLHTKLEMIIDQAKSKFDTKYADTTENTWEKEKRQTRIEIAKYLTDQEFSRNVIEHLNEKLMSYMEILRNIRPKNTYTAGGAILLLARRTARVSPILDGATVSWLRNLYNNQSDAKLEENFIDQVRKKSKMEQGSEDYKRELDAYAELFKKVRVLQEKQILGIDLSDEDQKFLEDAFKKRYTSRILDLNHLYSLVEYLIDNGDLIFLWGIKDTDTVNNVSEKSSAGRTGDIDDSAW